VMVADQLTDNRVHGVMDRGDHSNISTCISKAIDNEFSGNMIDVCPVGALTDKTFRFKSSFTEERFFIRRNFSRGIEKISRRCK